jgi:hypothetical protein
VAKIKNQSLEALGPRAPRAFSFSLAFKNGVFDARENEKALLWFHSSKALIFYLSG